MYNALISDALISDALISDQNATQTFLCLLGDITGLQYVTQCLHDLPGCKELRGHLSYLRHSCIQQVGVLLNNRLTLSVALSTELPVISSTNRLGCGAVNAVMRSSTAAENASGLSTACPY